MFEKSEALYYISFASMKSQGNTFKFLFKNS